MLMHALVLTVFAACQASALPHATITEGQDTTIEDHPYQVSVQIDGDHVCGGAILTPKHIITAAQCGLGGKDAPLTVRVGSTSRQNGGFVYEVTDVNIHPLRVYEGLTFDVGIMVLNGTIQYSSTAQPIELLEENRRPAYNELLTATGWGFSRNRGTSRTAVNLQALEVPFVDDTFCSWEYKDTFYKEGEMFCVGRTYDSSGAMLTDAGGPVVTKKGELVGVYSAHHSGHYGVFTNVTSSEIHKFIRDKTV